MAHFLAFLDSYMPSTPYLYLLGVLFVLAILTHICVRWYFSDED